MMREIGQLDYFCRIKTVLMKTGYHHSVQRREDALNARTAARKELKVAFTVSEGPPSRIGATRRPARRAVKDQVGQRMISEKTRPNASTIAHCMSV